MTFVYTPHGPYRDLDNSVASCKWIMDGLTVRGGGGGLLLDDRPGYITTEYRNERGPKRGIRIEIEEVSDGEGMDAPASSVRSVRERSA